MAKRDIVALLKDKSGIQLDIACGASKQEGFVGIDQQDLPGVDIVHDIEQTPWPLPDACANLAIASHILEHINPHGGVFINVMNEIWRLLKPNAKLMLVVPYAGSMGFYQDPTHCNPIIEATFYYFDPDPEQKYVGRSLYRFYQPKPWQIEFMAADRNGNLEAVLRKRRDDKSFHEDVPADITKEASGVHKSLF